MIDIHRIGRGAKPVRRASLAEIEAEIAAILDVIENTQALPKVIDDDPIWQVAEAVRGLAWAVGSLALHHADATAGGTENTAAEIASRLTRPS